MHADARRFTILLLLVVGVSATAQTQTYSQQLQAQQQRDLEVRAEEQRRFLAHEARERAEKQRADDELLLLRRRADAERQHAAAVESPAPMPAEIQEKTRSNPDIPAPVDAPVAPVHRGYDFSPGLMARALGGGLLAGAVAFLLGKTAIKLFHLGTGTQAR